VGEVVGFELLIVINDTEVVSAAAWVAATNVAPVAITALSVNDASHTVGSDTVSAHVRALIDVLAPGSTLRR
jgi:hypothetical protein